MVGLPVESNMKPKHCALIEAVLNYATHHRGKFHTTT